ncbi:MAG: helix-hairpin-helix domain-containing protein [Burkholderiaceae bacterium]|nr:MAG: helix-hairpin-helix domain-containing protein [Burkholderiaceae bacterium]
MLKKILAIVAMLYAVASFAAVDVNKATAAELDGLKGIGPGISSKIVDERKKGDFKDWNDFIERVKGVGDKNAATFSSEGMTVNGSSFKGAPATPAAKASTKKADAKPATAAEPAATVATTDEKKDAKADAKAKKAAKAEAKKKKADDAKAAKAAKSKAKADAAKPAASAAKN